MNINKYKLRMSQFSKTIILNNFVFVPFVGIATRAKKSSNKMCVITMTLFRFFTCSSGSARKLAVYHLPWQEKLLLLNIKSEQFLYFFWLFEALEKLNELLK